MTDTGMDTGTGTVTGTGMGTGTGSGTWIDESLTLYRPTFPKWEHFLKIHIFQDNLKLYNLTQ